MTMKNKLQRKNNNTRWIRITFISIHNRIRKTVHIKIIIIIFKNQILFIKKK